MSPSLFLQAILNGLLIGSIYGLSALGLTLVWGIMDVVNLAHGELILLGAYLNFWLFTLYGVNPLLSLLLSIPLGVIVGFILHTSLIRHVVGKSGLTTLLLTFGLSIFLNNAMLNLWLPDTRTVAWLRTSVVAGGVVLPGARLLAFGVVLLMTTGLYFFLLRTYSGKAIRAVMQDAEAAAAMGVNTGAILRLSFIIGTILATVAGNLICLVLPFAPANALQYAIMSFVIVVVGGLGRPLGALLGGLMVGLVESFTGTFISQAYTPAAVSFLLIVFLLLRPGGLFGQAAR